MPEPTDPFNVVRCVEYSAAFDYDHEEVMHDARPPSQFIYCEDTSGDFTACRLKRHAVLSIAFCSETK